MAFQIVRNDIVKMKVDAVVNSANPRARIGIGVDSAIYYKAGVLRLLKARKKIGDIAPGQAAATPGFGLEAKYIIHTVGPVWKDGEQGEQGLLYSCYRESLKLAAELGCESIAFPMISTGAYRFPKALALQTAVSAISEFLMQNEMEVYLVVFDKKSFELSEKLFSGVDAFINEQYVSEAKRRQGGTEVFESTLPLPMRNSQVFEERAPMVQRLESMTEPDGEVSAFYSRKSVKARSLEEVISQLGETFSQCLFRLIDEKGKTDVEVYKKANLDRKLFSKIRSNENYQPSKKTALALAVSLELNLDETRDFLAKAGLAFSPCSVSDLIVQYFIMNGVYDIYQINLSLFDHNQQTLG